MPKKIRYGLISTAGIGLKAHIPAIKASINSEIIGISSRNVENAKAVAKEQGIPLAFGSYQEMIDSDQIDAVINTLPNSMHHEWTIKAAKAGKHILCEKPLAATMAEAREMIEVANENDVLLVEGFTPRWNKQLREIRQLIKKGEIGDVIRIDTCLTFTSEDINDIRFNQALAGGSMMDAGCYAVYASRFVMGSEPISAVGFERKREGVNVDTTFSGLLKFPNDAVANVWSSLEGPPQLPFIATGTKGVISLEQSFDENMPITISRDGVDETIELSSEDRFKVQVEEFSNCILTGQAPEFSTDDAIKNMAVIMALYKSARTNQVIAVDTL